MFLPAVQMVGVDVMFWLQITIGFNWKQTQPPWFALIASFSSPVRCIQMLRVAIELLFDF